MIKRQPGVSVDEIPYLLGNVNKGADPGPDPEPTPPPFDGYEPVWGSLRLQGGAWTLFTAPSARGLGELTATEYSLTVKLGFTVDPVVGMSAVDNAYQGQPLAIYTVTHTFTAAGFVINFYKWNPGTSLYDQVKLVDVPTGLRLRLSAWVKRVAV